MADGLSPSACHTLDQPQKEQFQLGRSCINEFLDKDDEGHEKAKWLVALDAAVAFAQPEIKGNTNFGYARAKAAICVRGLALARQHPHLAEAYNAG